MAVKWCTSLGHRVMSNLSSGGSSGLTSRALIDVTPTISIDTSVSRFGLGDYSMKIDGAVATQQNIQHTISTQLMGIGFWVKVASGSISNNMRLCRVQPTNHDVYITTTGAVRLSMNATVNVNGMTLDRDRWYWITVSYDTSGATHLGTVRIYDDAGYQAGPDITNSFSAGAGVTQTTAVLGSGAVLSGVNAWMAHMAMDEDVVTLLTPRRVYFLGPNGDGTHIFTAGDFKDAAGTTIVNPATPNIYTYLTEVPPDLTAFAQQAVTRSTSYLEIAYADLPASGFGAIDLVQIGGAFHPVAAQTANTSQMHLNDGGTITAEALLDMTKTTNTLEYLMHGYTVRPNGGGAWDASSVNALKCQWGFKNSGTTVPAWDASWLEVCAVMTPATRATAPLFVNFI